MGSVGFTTTMSKDTQGGFYSPNQLLQASQNLTASTPSGVPDFFTVKDGRKKVWEITIDRAALSEIAQTKIKRVTQAELDAQRLLDSQRGVTHTDAEVEALAKEQKLYKTIINTYNGRYNQIYYNAAQSAYNKTFNKAIADGHSQEEAKMFASRRANDIMARGLVNTAKSKTNSSTVFTIGKKAKKGMRRIKPNK